MRTRHIPPMLTMWHVCRALVLTLVLLPLYARAYTETFTTAGTANWTVPAGVYSVIVECWGGGGAGGGGNNTSGNGAGGGGGGAYAKTTVSVTPGAVYSRTVGAAGSGGTGDGGAGGDSYFSTSSTRYCSGAAGQGGLANGNGGTGGAGGTVASSTGDTKYAGGTGYTPTTTSGGGGGSSGGSASTGNNGTTTTGATAVTNGGPGGNGGAAAANGSAPASGPGGGGGGGGQRSGGSESGGAGYAGKIQLMYSSTTVISGTLYSDEGTTQLTVRQTIKIAIGTTTPATVYSTTTDLGAGTYSFSFPSALSKISATTSIVVWVDGSSTTTAVTVTRAQSPTPISGLDLYQNRLIVRHEASGGVIDLTDLATYDGSKDSDIPYLASTSTATLVVSPYTELHVWTGKAFAPGGTVTIQGNASSTSATDGTLHLDDNTMYAARGATVLAGSLYIDPNTTLDSHWMPSGYTFFFNATTTGKYLVPAGTSTLGDLSFSSTNGGWTITNSATTTSLTIAGGTLDLGQNTLTVLGDLSQGGTFLVSGGTLALSRVTGTSNLSGTLTGTSSLGSVTFATTPAAFDTDGVVDGVTASNIAYAITNDGTYLYIAGDDSSTNWRIEKRDKTTGALDTGFGTAGVVTNATGYYAEAITNDGTYLYIAGYNSSADWRIEKRLMSTGALADIAHTLTTYTFSSNASTSAFTVTSASTTVVAPPLLTVTGTFTNYGTFTPGTGTTTLEGTTHTLYGSTTFYTLEKRATTTATTTFEAGSRTTVTGNLILTGTSMATPHYLRSSTPGSYWYLDPQGSRTVANLNVKDSYNANDTEIECLTSVSGCTSGGHNVNWVISAPFFGSAEDRQLYVGQATTTLGDLTLIEDMLAPSITMADDIRIVIATTTTAFRFDSTASVTFSGTAAGKVSGVSYENNDTVLKVNVTEDFATNDTLAMSGVRIGGFTTTSTTTSHLTLQTDGNAIGKPAATDPRTFRITGALTLADHTQGQATNQFMFLNSTDVPLFAFALTASGEYATVTALTLSLAAVTNMDTTKLSDIRLYRDHDGNGTPDTFVASGTPTMSGYGGTITFTTPFVASSTAQYLITADLSDIAYANRMILSLPASGITALGHASLYAPVFLGSVTNIEHRRGRAIQLGGKGDGGNGPVGGASPQGIIRSGGASSGGTRQAIDPDTGTPIGAETGFLAPTTTGSPHNEWTNGTNAYLSDGSYASANTDNLRQSYATYTFSIPGSNTVTGIAVRLEAHGSTATGTLEVALSWDGGTSHTAALITPQLTATDAVYTLGGESTTWGRSWTPLELSDGTFRVRVIAHPDGNIVRIDAIQVRPYHQAGGGGGGGGGGAI